MLRVCNKKGQIPTSRVEPLKGPIHSGNLGQMGAVVFAHFAIDQAVELVIHSEEEIPILLVQGKIIHFIGIVLKVEQLYIIDLKDLFNSGWTVVLLGIKVAAVFVSSVIHGSNG